MAHNNKLHYKFLLNTGFVSKTLTILGILGASAAVAGPTYVTLQASSPGTAESGHINVTGNVIGNTFRADGANSNPGSLGPGILLGSANSGEGMSSARTGGSQNLNGIDLYTNYTSRVSVTNSGNVGIGTKTPAQKLTVAGNISATGSISASNLPAVKFSGYGAATQFVSSQNHQSFSLTSMTVSIPANGFLKITYACDISYSSTDCGFIPYIKIAGTTYPSYWSYCGGWTESPVRSLVIPVTPGAKTIEMFGAANVGTSSDAWVENPYIMAEFYPNTL